MREWLSGGAPPCQGGGRGFDPRLALFLFFSENSFRDFRYFFCLHLPHSKNDCTVHSLTVAVISNTIKYVLRLPWQWPVHHPAK